MFVYWLTRLSYKQVVVFLDVGQGSSVLIQNNKCQVLVDFGNSYKSTYALGSILKPTDNTLEHAFITHMDKDHSHGLINLAQRYKIENIYISQFAKYNLPRFNLNIVTTLAPSTKTLCGIDFELLWPRKDLLSQGSKNENSIVIYFEFNNHSFLLSADIGCVSEKQIIQFYPNLKADVLQSGHHGSKHSSCIEYLSQVSPEFVVTQAGYKNRYNHPHPEFINRLNSLKLKHLRTDLSGDIIFDVSKPQLQVIQNPLKLPKLLQVRFRELKAL